MVILRSALKMGTISCFLRSWLVSRDLITFWIVSKKTIAQLESPGTFEMAWMKFWQVSAPYLPEIIASSILFMILFAKPSELLAICWIVAFAICLSFWSLEPVVSKKRIWCWTSSRFWRRDGQYWISLSEEILCSGSLVMNWCEILDKNSSLLMRYFSILTEFYLKTFSTISFLRAFLVVGALIKSASFKQILLIQSMNSWLLVYPFSIWREINSRALIFSSIFSDWS